MDSSCKKNYCTHEIDAKYVFDNYFSAHVPYLIIKESSINVSRAVCKAFRTGMVTGRTVIDCSFGPIAYHLLAICDFVQKITVLKLNDGCLKELEKWKNKDQDAFDWAHATEFLQDNSHELEDKEEKLRGKIDKILKWDPSKGDPTDVLALSKADIVITMSSLELISKDNDEYRRSIRNIVNAMNPEGYLLLYACINASYCVIGEDRIHHLPCDESFYKKVISEEGLEVKHFKKIVRRSCTDALDHEGSVFIIAQKVKKQ